MRLPELASPPCLFAIAVTLSACSVTDDESLAPEALADGSFESSYVGSGVVQLTEGSFEDVEARTVVTLPRGYTAQGDLDGDGKDDAAVVLASNTGGSGVFHDLLAVAKRRDALATLASVFLGDRVKVEGMAIVDGQIVLDMVVHGENEPLCCPTQKVTRHYSLKDGALIEATPDE